MGMIPTLGATGIYTVSEPFKSVIVSNMSYCCMAIRRLSDIVGLGIDPYDVYYQPHGLPQSRYEQDLKNTECIVSLQNSNGEWAYIPSSFITGYPELNGIPYTCIGLFAQLGALPDRLDLTYLKTKVADVIQSVLGVSPSITTLVTSPRTIVTQEAHLTAESARQSQIGQTTTDYSEIIDLRARNAALQNKVVQLESYIASLTP